LLRAEAWLKLTFLGSAQAAGDDEAKAARNFANAGKAYRALLRSAEVVKMTDTHSAKFQVVEVGPVLQ
jgi:hypothetical protein